MTYFEAMQDIIEMYNNYSCLCAKGNRSCGNHSEAVALAVEALSIISRSNKEKVETLSNNTILELEDAFDKHFKMGDI